MRVGVLLEPSGSIERVLSAASSYSDAGFDGVWMSQIFGYDSLTMLALIGSQLPDIELGTAVLPVHPRHPQVLAQQALTVQAAISNRLTLGIGLSHKVVVEDMWGLSYDRPLRYMREYLGVLLPLLRKEVASQTGELVSARTMAPIDIENAKAPPVLVAALGSQMLELAGTLAAGTITWMTGTKTVANHIVPSIERASSEAKRPAPRVVVALPVVVTNDLVRAADRIDKLFAIYPNLASYRSMLDKEGANSASDIALIGSKGQVEEQLQALSDAGATDYIAAIVGDEGETMETVEFLGAMGSRC